MGYRPWTRRVEPHGTLNRCRQRLLMLLWKYHNLGGLGMA